MRRRSLSPGRIFVVVLGVLLLALAMWLPRRDQDMPLRVAIGMWTGSESVLLARERELLPAARFQWVEVTWPSALSSALENGVVDAAVLSLESVVKLLESGEDLRVVCIMDESNGADAVLSRDDIRSVEDLKGKRVGVDLRGPGRHLLAEVLAQTKLKVEDLELVSILQPEMEDVLARGDVAAVVAAEPWMTKMVRDKARILADSKSAQTPVFRVLVVKARALADQREAIKELLRAHLAMVPVLRAAAVREPGMEAVLRRQELTQVELAAIITRVRHLSVAENRELMKDDGGGKLNQIITRLMECEAGAGKAKPPPHAMWVDGSLLEEVSP